MLLNKIDILEIPRNLKNSEEWCVKVGSATNTEIATALTHNPTLQLRKDDVKEERPQNKLNALPFISNKFRLVGCGCVAENKITDFLNIKNRSGGSLVLSSYWELLSTLECRKNR